MNATLRVAYMAQAMLYNALSEFLPPALPASPACGATVITQAAPTATSYFPDGFNTTVGPTAPNLESAVISSLPALLLSLAIRNQDMLKLMLIGTVIETSRRLANAGWQKFWAWFLDAWYLTVTFESNDESFSWMMAWLSKQSIWSDAQAMKISTLHSRQTHYTAVELHEDDLMDQAPGLTKKQRMGYRPAHDTTHWLKYKGVWISTVLLKPEKDDVTDWRVCPNPETLVLNIYTRDRGILKSFLKEAKSNYKDSDENFIGLYKPTAYDEWHRTSSRKKRSINSVILEPEVKDKILDDAVEFLSSEKWYTDRGIPYRRGYLLHGVPGSGKTSLIHSIAGELDLDVYVVSLAKKGLDDSSLNELFCNLPERSILLIEDIDAAFERGITARSGISGTNTNSDDSKSDKDPGGKTDNSGITLSGLLNALDGIAAAEGRILFATTNRYSALDEALRRPGRMDVHVEFKYATRWQTKELFKSFYPSRGENTEEDLMWNNRRVRTRRKLSPFTEEEAEELAEKFADIVPADTFSVASMQGHLMLYKERPAEAVEAAEAWVKDQLAKRQAAKEKAEAAEKEKVALEKKRQEKVQDVKEIETVKGAEGG